MAQQKQREIYIRLMAESVSPRRTIPAEDLHVDRNDLPQEVRQVLRMDVVQESSLRPGRRMRKRAEDLLADFATKTDLGWLTDQHALKELVPRLKTIREEYQEWRETLASTIDQQTEDMVADLENRYASEPWVKELATALRRYTPGPERIRRALRFQFYVYETKGVRRKHIDDLSDMHHQVVEGLVEEVASVSGDVLQAIYGTGAADSTVRGVAPRTLNRICQLGDKVDRLAFVDSRLHPVRDGLSRLRQSVIDPAVAAGRRVPMSELGEAIAALSLLSDTDELWSRLENGDSLVWQRSAGTSSATVNVIAPSAGPSPSSSSDSPVADDSMEGATPAAFETSVEEAADEAPATEPVAAPTGIGEEEEEDDEEVVLPRMGV